MTDESPGAKRARGALATLLLMAVALEVPAFAQTGEAAVDASRGLDAEGPVQKVDSAMPLKLRHRPQRNVHARRAEILVSCEALRLGLGSAEGVAGLGCVARLLRTGAWWRSDDPAAPGSA